MRLDRSQLADRIEQTARLSFEGRHVTKLLQGSFGSVTRGVKKVFGDLGKSLGYQVAAAGYSGADEGEWLYDMVWFASDAGVIVQLAMILESELKPGGRVQASAEVDGDFQKLVQARADVRVWLALCPNRELTQQHIASCKRQARLFAGTAPGDTYIFIVYDWTTKDTLVKRFQVEAGEV
jgi:hypothetical protein